MLKTRIKEANKPKVKMALIVSGLIGGILLIIGFSYAWMFLNLRGTKKVSIQAGPLDVYIDNENADLELINAIPQPDDIGLQGDPYTFQLVNNTLNSVDYMIYLADNETARSECTTQKGSECVQMEDKNVRFQFIEDRPDGYQWDETENLGEKPERLLMSGTIPKQTTYDYKLRLWIDIKATNEIIGQYFFGKIKVYAVQREDNENPDPPTPPSDQPAKDGSGANPPELGDRLIPVVYDEETTSWEVADTNTKGAWYNYNDQRWANAVLVDPTKYTEISQQAAGTDISMDEIIQMYVWIPRYSYTIQGTYGKGSSTTRTTPGEIDVKFVSKGTKDSGTAKYTSGDPTEWYTPDAFTLGGRNLSGIWVGKFESGYKGADTTTAAQKNVSEPQNVIIKPDVYSWRSITVSNIYSTAKRIAGDISFGLSESIYDSHAMKNDEWGAVAYLTQSKYGKYGNEDYEGANKEVYINNFYNTSSDGYKTGCSGEAPGVATSKTCTPYNNLESAGDGKGQKGPGASTTGNIYGVYDMAGGAWEYVMGNYSHTVGSSGFTGVWDTQYKDYINFYTTSTASTACSGTVCKSHALSETAGWYGDYSGMVTSSNPWFVRGGGYSVTASAGVFYYGINTGGTNGGISFRVVLTLNKTA